MYHGLAAPGGGVQAGLPPCYQKPEALKRHGQGTLPKLQSLHVPGLHTHMPPQRNKIYLGSMWHFPLNPQEMARSTRADTLFVALREAIPHLYPRNFPRNTWILQKNWYLIYQDSAGHRYPIMYQLQLRRLSQRVRYNLRAYWARRVKVTGE